MVWIMTFVYVLLAISFAWLLYKGVCKNDVSHSIFLGMFWLLLIILIPVSLVCRGVYAIVRYFEKLKTVKQ